MISVAVVDHGAGNLVSMLRALETVGSKPSLVASGSVVGFDRVVLPGVGATGPAMRRLRETGLDNELRGYSGPLLGVCVGMQLLFDYSTEDDTECLGLVPGTVDQVDASPLPHIGWNAVTSKRTTRKDDLYYFVHSFAARPSDPDVVTGWTSYGDDTFASSIARDNILGVQFHPERSGEAGLEVLADFVGSKAVRSVA